MTFKVIDAEKVKSKARIGIAGPAGSGKTYSALAIGQCLGEGRTVLIDTENESSAKYSKEFKFRIIPFPEGDYSPSKYVEAIRYAESLPEDVIVVDSISHAWAGTGGALEMVDTAARKYSGNRFAAWRDVTPEHNKLVSTLLHCKKHLIVTLRSKQEYTMDTDEFTGRATVRKLGMAPIQREGMDYEFDITGDMDMTHHLTISKTRCTALDGKSFLKPGCDIARIIMEWLEDGVELLGYTERRFMARWGIRSWKDAQEIIGDFDKPTTVDEWDAMNLIMEGMM